MAADEKERFIQYLVGKVNMYELDKRATELAVEEFQTRFDSVSYTMNSLKKEMACPVGGILVNFSKRYLMDVEISLV